MIEDTHNSAREIGLFAVLLCATGLLLGYFNLLERWDRFIYDHVSTGPIHPAPEDILIIAIDRNSLAHYGEWPWSLGIHAELIDKLSLGGAKVIGLDIIFSQVAGDDPRAEGKLAAAIARNGRVILPVLAEQTEAETVPRLTLPLPKLMRAAAGLGQVEIELDPDGIARSVYLKAGLGSADWSVLALAMLQFAEVGAPIGLSEDADIAAGVLEPWVRDKRVLVPFAGPPGHINRISYVELMSAGFDISRLRDKFVLVGAMDPRLGDTHLTQVSGQKRSMAGVEINANLLHALRHDLVIQPLSIQARLLLIVGLLLVPVMLYPHLHSWQTVIALLVSLLVAMLVTVVLLRWFQLWFAPASTLVALLLSYPLWSWRRLEHTTRKLFAEKEQAKLTLDTLADAVITTDAKGRVEYMNAVAEKLAGQLLSQARGARVKDLLPITDASRCRDLNKLLVQCLQQGRAVTLKERGILIDREGHERTVHTRAGPILNSAGEVQGAVLHIRDISETARKSPQMAYQATHDILTGLPNRSLLLDRLDHAIAQAGRSEHRIAVLLIDLDHFKKVNDRLGDSGGDLLLDAIAARLKTCSREGDTLARLGGDEFVVLLENLSHSETAATVAGKLLESLVAPCAIGGQEIFITGSIGISLHPKDGDDAETLLKHADTAMYRVKAQGRNNFQFFSKEMNDRILERLELEKDLRYALDRGELDLYFQPQLDLETRRICGAEALLRWHRDGRGMIPPSKFIPIAEESGLILPIGEWVLHNACRQAREWLDEGLPPLRIAVNLSPRQFMSCDIIDTIIYILKDTGVDPGLLELEITEGLIMQDIPRSAELLNKFKSVGGRISIDDFGTGYSSLNYLKQFPVDHLKIDESFINDIVVNRDDRAIVQAIITMAHGMGLKVIAEGVEFRPQVSLLRAQQCDEIQGYYFSPAVPPAGIPRLLRDKPLQAFDRQPVSGSK